MALIISVKKILKKLKVPSPLEMYAHEIFISKQVALDIEHHICLDSDEITG